MCTLKHSIIGLMVIGLMGSACSELDEVETVHFDKNGQVTESIGPSVTAADLRTHITNQGVYTPVVDGILPADDPKVKLGMLLFFDKIVSGNEDIACSTCHHPNFGTSDGLPTSIGVGGAGLGPVRALGVDGFVIPRNAPDLFNRGASEWSTMFWDARVAVSHGYFDTPAGENTPMELDSVLAAQALFPPTSRHEMRGEPGENVVGDVADDNIQGIWDALITRILKNEEYVQLFAQAYPELTPDELGFEHAANAIAAYEIAAFTRLDTPFDRFLGGDLDAMTDQQLRGAELFYGKAGCSSCHSGALLTDQKSHCIGAPQLGPGKDEETREDIGRALVTKADDDRFAFRTPPLRNVELTAPYMHSGAFMTLREAIVHHVQPETTLKAYKGENLEGLHNGQEMIEASYLDEMVTYLSGDLSACSSLNNADIDALVAFMGALTDESSRDMTQWVPTQVPSGHLLD
ncbi:MAG: cytochrome c peroxidase [Myxococcota bacterium]|nr:cytochrome c peroxidase [Myxococcota bacterium]